MNRQHFQHAFEDSQHLIGGIIPSIFATALTADKSLSIKLQNKKKLLAQYSSKHVRLYRSFCPDMIQLLFKDDTVDITSTTKTFTAACMTIDLSGFTILTAGLCKQGNAGLDELRTTMNVYFGQFVDTVKQYGGDVLYFAGDALICTFPSEESRGEIFAQDTDDESDLLEPEEGRESAGNCCLQAVRCALAVNRSCAGGDLKTHSAVTYGEMCISSLGGHEDVWTYVVNGESMKQMGSCLDDASPEEVVLSAGAFAALPRNCFCCSRLSSGNFLVGEAVQLDDETVTDTQVSSHALPTSSHPVLKQVEWGLIPPTVRQKQDSAAALVQFIPRPVLEAISAGLLNGLSELRTVTSVFVKLDNYTFGGEEDVSALQSYFLCMQRCLAETGGFLRQFLVDDKGCVLIGIWGVPTATYPNNCTRALRCAAEMLRGARELLRSVSIGIASGRAYCGTIGSSALRQDYVAIGRSINLSARLMSKSQGGIILDQETFERLPLDVSEHMSALPPMRCKGFSELVVCFKYHSQSTPPDSTHDARGDSSLVIENYTSKALDDAQNCLRVMGEMSARCSAPSLHTDTTASLLDRRDEEGAPGEETGRKGSTGKCLDPRFSSGRPHFFVIKGSPGVGKTAVATYLSRRCKKEGFGVHFIKVAANDPLQRFSATRRLLIDLVGGASVFDTEAKQREVVLSLMKKCFAEEEVEGKWAVTRFPAIREVLGLKWDQVERHEGYYNRTVNAEADTIPRILSMLLSARSLLVVIDNAHFMCRHSWDFLVQLSSLPCRSLIVLTLRVDDNKSFSNRAGRSQCTLIGARSNGSRRTRYTASVDDTLSEDFTTIGHIGQTASEHLRKTLLGLPDDAPPSPTRCAYGSPAGGRDTMGENSFSERYDAFEVDCVSDRVGLYRHHTEYEHLHSLCHPFLLSELHLRPLNVKSVKTLLLNSFDHSTYACEKMIRTVYRMSKGNPFWCWKIIKFVKNSGKSLLEFDHQMLMGCVLDKFTDTEKSVVKCASVIGEEFGMQILQCILAPFLLAEIDDLLLSLVDGGIVFRMTEGVYSFRSSLIRDFIYSLIPPTDAASMHFLVAECMEYYHQDELHAYMLSLSYHYSMCSSKEREKALHYSSRAALICFGSSQFREGTIFIKNSLRFVLVKKDILGLLMIVESGLSSIEDYENETGAGRAESAGSPVRVYRLRLVDIRKRLLEAYMSLGSCAPFLRLFRFPSLMLWAREKLRGSPQVHAAG